MGKRSRQILAATMIVKNEEAILERCLTSLQGIVDEIHVHDTGSTDSTPEIAAEFGAHVTHGPWTDDFAAARNAALEGWTADWALVVDADDQMVADGAALRDFLATTRAGVIFAEVHNIREYSAESAFPSGRVFRPRWGMWTGKVHEQLIGRTKPLRTESVPPHVLHVRHSGYLCEADARARSERNLEIARSLVDDLVAQGDAADPVLLARTIFDLGRSQVGAGRRQDAVDAFETVRELFPGTTEWVRATDFLARQVLAADMPDVCLVLTDQLRTAGTPAMYCDWLAAQALVRLGDIDTAHQLLAGVTEVVDTTGLHREPSVLRELKELVGALGEAVGAPAANVT
jgi:hypothetical protein